MKKVMDQQVKGLNKKIEGILGQESSKSQKMKDLFDLGIEIKVIASHMNVRYNFVYNVISNHVAMNEIAVESSKKQGESKKDKIVELFNQGKSNKEISIELKTNYNYVFNVLKDYKSQQAK
jgi:hypothetical protein